MNKENLIPVKCKTQLGGYNVNIVRNVCVRPRIGEMVQVINLDKGGFTDYLEITDIRHCVDIGSTGVASFYLELELGWDKKAIYG